MRIPLEQWAQAAGFTSAAPFLPRELRVREEVREMCRSGRCGCFGTCWTCPPYCGTLEECAQAVHSRKRGFLVCSTARLEDPFDYEGMKKAEEQHKRNFYRLAGDLAQQVQNLLSLGAGACTICSSCTCPTQPCRHPELAVSSMEGYGLLVEEVCRLSGVPYYGGEGTISYFSCYLYDDG